MTPTATRCRPPSPRRRGPGRLRVRARCRWSATDGSQTLELALALPVVALVLLAALQLVAVVGDAVAAQEAARRGVRVATTSDDDEAVRRAVTTVLGPGRDATTSITGDRTAGGDVVVEVVVTSRFGHLRPRVSGRAAARGEPLLGREVPR